MQLLVWRGTPTQTEMKGTKGGTMVGTMSLDSLLLISSQALFVIDRYWADMREPSGAVLEKKSFVSFWFRQLWCGWAHSLLADVKLEPGLWETAARWVSTTFFNRALVTTLTALSRDGPWMLLKMNKLRDTKFCEVGRIFEEVTHGLGICNHSQCNCYCEFFQQGVNEYGLEAGAPLDG